MTEDVDKSDAQIPPGAQTEKPAAARRKRSVKNAVPVDGTASEALAVDPAPDAGFAAVAPVKPPRKRRVAVAAEHVGDEPVPLLTELGTGAAPSLLPELATSAPASPDKSADGEAAEGEPSESGESTPAEEAGGRGRRRRRDRGDRGGRGEMDAAPPAAAAAVPSADDEDDDDEASDAVTQPRPAPMDPSEVFAQVVSGEYDASSEEVPEPPAAHKRVLLPEPEAPKLQKVLAQSGIGSRRDMETLIQEGQVTVNGEPAHIGQRISFGDRITVRGKPIRVRIVPPPPRIIAYHKPAGEVVTHDDPQNRPTVFRRLPRLQQGKWQSVGRLDLNTEGLLLFTNSGELANQLMHPRFGVEREYAVRVLGKLDDADRAQLLEGVSIDGQTASFRSIEDGGGEGANHWYRVVITEGRNREVRKLFDAVELTVSRLIRIRYGTVVLPRGLKRGVWVDLDPVDVRAIRQLAGGQRNEARAQPPAQEPAGRPGRGRNKGRGNDRGERADRPPQGRVPQPERGVQPERQAQRPNPRAEGPSERERDRNDDMDDDFDPSRIPNPLEQTFDKRFVQNPRTPAGGRGFGRGGGGFGAGGSAPSQAPRKPGSPREPDPLQTSVGYIGADAFHRKNRGGGGGGGGGGGNRGGGGFGGGNRGGGGGGGGGRRGR